jgi:electron transport complex protein RnfB
MTPDPSLADAIDAVLPQTQCERCGYPGCRPYAEAIASGAADINQCPPGGAAGIATLAGLLGRDVKPLDPARGVEKPREVARVVEADCIGCTKCIQVCPTDAILGASKHMHTVLVDECTGCELCVARCPVDCIVMEPAPVDPVDPVAAGAAPPPNVARAAYWRGRHRARKARLERLEAERLARLAARTEAVLAERLAEDPIQAALARARAKRGATP